MKWLFRYLFLDKEIISKTGVLHFRRWRIISTPWFGVFIHQIYKADEDKHLHDHPWNYCSLILRGTFSENEPGGFGNILYPWRMVRRKAEQFHKIGSIVRGPVVTLFMIGKRRRDWGYRMDDGSWMQNEEYRKLKNEGKL